MSIQYLILRVIRHFLPETVTRFLLRKAIIIKPAIETSKPKQAAQKYTSVLSKANISIMGKHILIFGYGGNYGTACALLKSGASHVTLIDLFAPPNNPRNLELMEEYSQYLQQTGEKIHPNPEYISLAHGDICDTSKDIRVDIVLSNSVYEHLDGVEAITQALASCTAADGTQLHFVNLRDHYFKYPFKMLTFSEKVWRTWLNPTSNLNRYRIWDYQRVFEAHYGEVDIQVTGRDEESLKKELDQIRPEFLSGEMDQDSVTMISVLVSKPAHMKQ